MRTWSRASVTTLIIILILTGCTGKMPEVPASTAILNNTDSASAPTQTGIDETPEHQEEDTIAVPTSTSSSETQDSTGEAQPTPAPTLSDWREAPISPEEVSQRVIEIYQDGQGQGRDPHNFSVIGDCQAIPFVFMGPYGRGDLEPDAAESQLWNVINYFEGSFKRWSVTARGGFTAASLLNPLQADPDSCKPGETPLTCEFRLNNPSFVFVTLETWLEPETVDRYEGYLRQILDYVIERGTVPILLTKADASELRGKEHVINPAIVNLAYEYQLPVVNFWRSAQYLDNFGIDPGREGFHLSDAGYKLKNTLALRALYQVWSAVEGIETAEAAPPTPTGTPEPTPMPEIAVATVDCDSGCVFFGTAQSSEGTIQGGGVYAYDPDTKQLTQILETGFDLQDVSDDGMRLLANQSNRLYNISLADGVSELVTDSFYDLGKQGAYWNSDESEVIYLDQDSPLKTANGQGFNLLPSGEDVSKAVDVIPRTTARLTASFSVRMGGRSQNWKPLPARSIRRMGAGSPTSTRKQPPKKISTTPATWFWRIRQFWRIRHWERAAGVWCISRRCPVSRYMVMSTATASPRTASVSSSSTTCTANITNILSVFECTFGIWRPASAMIWESWRGSAVRSRRGSSGRRAGIACCSSSQTYRKQGNTASAFITPPLRRANSCPSLMRASLPGWITCT